MNKSIFVNHTNPETMRFFIRIKEIAYQDLFIFMQYFYYLFVPSPIGYDSYSRICLAVYICGITRSIGCIHFVQDNGQVSVKLSKKLIFYVYMNSCSIWHFL